MDGGRRQPGLPCREFHLFQRLPAELRLRIWCLRLPGPRIIPIKCGANPVSGASSPAAAGSIGQTTGQPSSPAACTSTAPVPALLHVCRESRYEAARRYRLMFGLAQQPGRVIVDPACDIVYFGLRDGFAASAAQLRTLLALARPDDLAAVRRVAVSDALFSLHGAAGGFAGLAPAPSGRTGCPSVRSLAAEILDLLRTRLPRLEELVFVPRDDNPVYSDDVVLAEPRVQMKALAALVHEAICVVREKDPGWAVPKWRIKVLANGEGVI